MILRILLILTALAISGCAESSDVSVQFFRGEAKLSPQLTVEVAATPEARALGLMYRKSLPANFGMLFLFPVTQPLSFWMKNTYVELDIVFLDEALRIESISKHAQLLTNKPRKSLSPARYVLEVEGGLADSWGLAVGDLLRIQGPLPTPR